VVIEEFNIELGTCVHHRKQGAQQRKGKRRHSDDERKPD
jgi:hypothetical protein